MIDLKPFCSTDPLRISLSEPWTSGQYTYATNGHILIRVPARSDVPTRDAAPKAEFLIDKVPIPKKWFSVPWVEKPKEPERVECFSCDGTGKDDSNVCEHCGKKASCPDCGGTGKVMELTSPKYRKIGSQSFDEKYLYLIRDLPGVQFGPTGSWNAARFTFDGGDGLLMPIKE